MSLAYLYVRETNFTIKSSILKGLFKKQPIYLVKIKEIHAPSKIIASKTLFFFTFAPLTTRPVVNHGSRLGMKTTFHDTKIRHFRFMENEYLKKTTLSLCCSGLVIINKFIL